MRRLLYILIYRLSHFSTKNFELLTQSLKDYLLQGYKLYILADSEKQTARLRDIFNSKEIDSEAETTSVADSIPFIPVNRTIHEGFVDNDLKVCFFYRPSNIRSFP